MRLPGGYCYSHLHYMCVCVRRGVRAHTHTRVPVDSRGLTHILVFVQSPGRGAGQEIYVLCRPDTALLASSRLIRAPTWSYVLL